MANTRRLETLGLSNEYVWRSGIQTYRGSMSEAPPTRELSIEQTMPALLRLVLDLTGSG